MTLVFLLVLCLLIPLSPPAATASPPVAPQPHFETLDAALTPVLAQQYFLEARALCDRDGGQLWGIPLYGPLMFVDPKTRTLIANQPDGEHRLRRRGDVYVGKLPESEIAACTAWVWAGVHWTMITWPPPKDRRERLHLMAHEMWHRIQEQLGLPPSSNAINQHLDTRDGRIWWRLESRALATALERMGAVRLQAIADALTFRAYRWSLFPNAAVEERAFELHEGLAEYTGIRLGNDSNEAAALRAIKNLRDAEGWPTLVRSAAYATGPAYGLLLDEAKPRWRKGLSTESDLATLLRKALGLSYPDELQAVAQDRAAAYRGKQVIASETKREDQRRERLAEYRRRLVDGPVLILPLRQVNFGFDPLSLIPLDDIGTVYANTTTFIDDWGSLTVTGGALLEADWSKVRVPAPDAPDARPLKGDGWTLTLLEGWELRRGPRQQDFTLRKRRP